MICSDYAVAVQKDLVAAYFVRPWPVAIGDYQNAAARRHLVKVEFIRLNTACNVNVRPIGHTGREGTDVHTWRISCELLQPRLVGLFLSRNRSTDEGTK
jgi:hypothetical protein